MKIPFVTPGVREGRKKRGWAVVSRIFTSNCQWSEPSTVNHLPIRPFLLSSGTLIKLSKIHTDSGQGIAQAADSPY